MKARLILEFTEFNAQRMNNDSVPQSTHVDNPQLSMGSLNKHEMNVRSSLSRLNDLYKDISKTSTALNLKNGDSIEAADIKNIIIQRIFPKEDLFLNVYFSFELNEKEYYGYINKINSLAPTLHCEVFKDTSIYGSREWAIRIKGNLIKVIKLWLNAKSGKYYSLREINAFDKLTGGLLLIPTESVITLISANDDYMLISFDDRQYYLRGNNYYYFNYYFKEVKEED